VFVPHVALVVQESSKIPFQEIKQLIKTQWMTLSVVAYRIEKRSAGFVVSIPTAFSETSIFLSIC
jgi:hypothetical protein